MRKKRVLFLTEATYLNTGYAKYSKEILQQLHSSGKYELAEISCGGSATDPRRSSIKWKNYAMMPDENSALQLSTYNKRPDNAFGAWRFERTLLDFEPDIVLSIRDFWMDAFVMHSPFRRLFSWCWMPTVDAAPQHPEWVSMFADADYLITYSAWAMRVVSEHAGSNVRLIGYASPAAAECFKPMDKAHVKRKFGIDPSSKIIGTVMRNQRRKLFPVLFSAFSDYIHSSGNKNTYLYCHTSYPDGGWDLADLLHSNNISSRVLFSYVCESCGHLHASLFNDSGQVCPKCSKFTSNFPNVSTGISDEQLAEVYNLFDLYVQCANSEGFGLPQIEAAACNIPIACTNYSAMQDVVDKLKAYPIKCAAMYEELETGCKRAVPCHESLVAAMESHADANFMKKWKSTRALYDMYYSWERSAHVWKSAIDNCEFADWNQPAVIKPLVDIPLNTKALADFMNPLSEHYTYTPSQNNSYFIRSVHKDLQRGTTQSGFDGYFGCELSPLNDRKHRVISRELVLKLFQDRLDNYNKWESVRQDRSLLKDGEEAWLN
jgi:glycosyltransferase involved in cell wall biosynthesis